MIFFFLYIKLENEEWLQQAKVSSFYRTDCRDLKNVKLYRKSRNTTERGDMLEKLKFNPIPALLIIFQLHFGNF